MPTPAPPPFVPKAPKPALCRIAAGAATGTACSPRPGRSARLCPAKGQLLREKGDANLAPARRCQLGEFKALRQLRGSEGSGSAVGNHPRPWIERTADGRTNSTGISVSHNLLPYSLPLLTFSSHGADLRLEKATRNAGRVSERQVVFRWEHHQGQRTRPQRIFLFLLKIQASFVPFSKEFYEKLIFFFLDRGKGSAAMAESCLHNWQ